MAQKREIYAVIVKMVNGCFTWEDAIEQIRPLRVTLDTKESEDTPPADICQDLQAELNVIIDDVWSLVEEHQFLEYRKITDGIRKLFIHLFEKLDKIQSTADGYCQQLHDTKEEVRNASDSKGTLLLGSLAIQILVKIGKFIDKNESPFTGAFRSLTEVNNLDNIDSFKTFLIQNGYNWSQLRTTIKMLKANRITTAHPADENTSHEDIQNAICACFPDESSLFHTKSMEALQLLQLLAEELKEPLFLRITH
jgi:hypothetical protein